MKWETLRKSDNVIDKRRKKIGFFVLSGIVAFFALNPYLPDYITNAVPDQDKIEKENFTDSENVQFIRTMLGVTEDVWKNEFLTLGKPYTNAKLVIFTDSVNSACGQSTSDVGPFYCPGDLQVYMDLTFFERFDKLLNMPGDAVQAYIVYHEVGHHVQNLMGTLPKTFAKMQRLPEKESNALLTRLELQADCYAGITFNKIKHIMEPGDVAEIVNAASKIGDDWLQKRFSGKVVPDSFTHGTSEQRAGWLMYGYKRGSIKDCDTFFQEDKVIKG